jgi:hypothetical protein
MFDLETKIKRVAPRAGLRSIEGDGRTLVRCGACHVGFAGPLAKTIRAARRHARTHRRPL